MSAISLRAFDYYVLVGVVAATFAVSAWFLLLLPLVVALDTQAALRRQRR